MKERSPAFLMEMIVVALFFALAAAICARLFGAAWLTKEAATALDRAVVAARDGVESVYAHREGFSEEKEGLNTVYTREYDEQWQPGEGPYKLEIRVSPLRGGVRDVQAQVLKGESVLYSLETKWHEEESA